MGLRGVLYPNPDPPMTGSSVDWLLLASVDEVVTLRRVDGCSAAV